MNYYSSLPENYKQAYSVDAKKTGTGIILNIIGIGLAFGVFYLIYSIKGESVSYLYEEAINMFRTLSYEPVIILACFALSIFAYLVLHELVHGLFYKIFTHAKLTFGITLSCAYCGVPQLYVKKVPMLITSLAPFVIFSLLGLIGLFLIPNGFIDQLYIILYALHIGGCIGDLFVAFKLLFYPADTLVNDTGAKQTFYIKEK